MTNPIDLNEFRERQREKKSQEWFDEELRKCVEMLADAQEFLGPDYLEEALQGRIRVPPWRDQPAPARPQTPAPAKTRGPKRSRTTRAARQPAAPNRVPARAPGTVWVTSDGWAFTQAQIDAVVALIRDPERVVAMGVDSTLLEAAMAAGWKPPEGRTP